MVCIVQYLCPERHCVMAAAFDDQSEETYKSVCQGLANRLLEMKADPFCGICGSTNLTFEMGKTKFKSLAQALPYLRATEVSNLITRTMLESTGQTFKSKSQN